MRKTAVVLPFAALALGAAGFFLRRAELAAAFEPSGFAKPHEPLTIALAALTVLVIVLSAAAAAVIRGRYQAEPKFERAYRMGAVTLLMGFLSGLAFLAGAAARSLELFRAGDVSTHQYIFIALGAISGFALLFLTRAAFTGRFAGGLSYVSVGPTLFFCFWLILIYRENAANPVLLSYAYLVLAACACAFLFYIWAGYAFGKAYTGKTAFGHLAAVYFTALVQAEEMPLWARLFFGASLVFAFFTGARFFGNLKQRDA